MEYIIGLMRQVSVVAVLAAFLELLLPHGEMQKFIRFFMGLLILVAFLNPFIKGQLLTEEMVAAEMADVIEPENSQMSTEEILAAGEKMDASLSAVAETQLKEEISLQILALVKLVSGVEQASVDIFFVNDGGRHNGMSNGDIATVRLTVIVGKGTDAAQAETDIYQLLEAFYHLPQEKIECIIREAAVNDSN